MLELLIAGGWPMIPIAIASAVMLAITLERFWTLRRRAVIPPGLGEEVRQWAASGTIDSQHLQALADTSPLGRLLSAALSVRDRPRAVIVERIESAGRSVVRQLDRYLTTLGTIALIAPLLGLFGTVIGMIEMFFAVMVSGVGDPSKMAGGIGQALVCTAAGLVVAIPAYVFHRWLRSHVTDLIAEMEHEAVVLVDDLTAAHESSTGAMRAVG